MTIYGKINQITSNSSTNNFLNLDTEYGVVSCWGNNYKTPTYIWMSGHTWGIKIFDDAIWVEEWIKSRDFKDSDYDFVYRISDNSFEIIYQKET